MSIRKSATAAAIAAAMIAGGSSSALAGDRGHHDHHRHHHHRHVDVHYVYVVPPHTHYKFRYNGEHDISHNHAHDRGNRARYGHRECYFTHYNHVCVD